MIKVTFHETAEDSQIKYAVIAARYKDKWVLCRHKERSTYEIPGGHRETGETVDETAKRELYEETGAIEFDIQPISLYKVDDYGMLYFADIKKFGELPQMEIAEIFFFDDLPDNLTYPLIQPALFEKAKDFLKNL